MSGRISIIMYHYVRELRHGRYSGIKGLETEDFKRQLDFLQANFHLITVEELLAAVDEGASLPDRAALLTFDDGYIDHYTNVFPVLKERGIQGFFSMPGKILAERKVLDVRSRSCCRWFLRSLISTVDESLISRAMRSFIESWRWQTVSTPRRSFS